nr:MAG TPA: hypothetical protein [Caudoviricetes sp.]
MSAITHTGVDFFLKMPVREFVELNQEVAEAWQKKAH